MILRDQHGEVTVPFGQLFQFENATLEVVCPDSEMTEREGQPVLCVRLKAGFVEKNGQRFTLAENGHYPLFGFTAALLASLVRAYRLTGPPVTPAPSMQQPARSDPKTPRARNSTKRAESDQPTTKSMFD